MTLSFCSQYASVTAIKLTIGKPINFLHLLSLGGEDDED